MTQRRCRTIDAATCVPSEESIPRGKLIRKNENSARFSEISGGACQKGFSRFVWWDTPWRTAVRMSLDGALDQ